jgi:Uma2 family endonuclease
MTTLRPHEDASGVGFVSILDGAYPTMDDLPSEFLGEEALPEEFHALFAMLLMETFFPKTFPNDRVFSVLDMYLYFQYGGKNRGFRPDWFGAVDVPNLYEGRRTRKSYVVSVEGKPPFIIVEGLSKGTEDGDLGRGAWPKENAPSKWDVYETVLKIPYYVTINHETDEVQLFRHDGTMFVRETSPDGRMWMPEIGLAVGPWRGVFHKRDAVWVRFFDEQGNLIPTEAEKSAQEKVEKEQALTEKWAALRTAEEERTLKEASMRATEEERLRRKLKALGIDID